MRFYTLYRWVMWVSGFLFLVSSSSAQSTWNLVGGLDIGGDCYRLTKNMNGQKGAAWSTTMINIKKPFNLYFKMNFGSIDPGADGIAVLFQRSPAGLSAIGDEGLCMGYASATSPITPSLDIEFDTYDNTGTWPPVNDISQDHCAINGNGTQGWTLAAAVPLLVGGLNVEDNQYHLVQISWVPGTTTLSVFFDCNQLQSLQVDMLNGLFSGDSMVYYGLTSSTGSDHNAQYFCELYHDAGIDTAFCPGVPVGLSGNSNFLSYSWSPATGLSCTNCLNPNANPYGSTTYVLSGTYGCLTVTDTVNLGTNCVILPIELTSFTATCDKNLIQLRWSTASETNNDYYVLERSIDAKSFEMVGIVDGAGTSVSSKNYSFVDFNPVPGVAYYRLMQVDLDGTYSYSKIVTVSCTSPLGLFVYPNPSHDIAHLRIYAATNSDGYCLITNITGEVVYQNNIKLLQGSNEILLNNTRWTAGIYDIAVISRDKTIHTLMVVE